MQKLRDYTPALKHGAKIVAEDLAMTLGLPYVSDIWYVDPNGGNDSTNSGSSFDDAFATVSQALSTATANQHDVIVIAPSGGTGRAAETAAITWNKRFTHLVGNAAPIQQDNRAGITFSSSGSLTISENGCIFKNLTFTSSADLDTTVTLTGSYNGFYNVDFKGTSNATSADSTPWRALTISGGQENYFGGCTFGADTMTRGAANATVEFASAASRNVFDGCFFTMHNDTANTPVHILHSGANSVDRWTMFRDCTFYSFWTNHADKTAGVFDLSSQTATCDVIMAGSALAVGFDDWEGTASNFIWFKPEGQDTTPTALVGLAENNA